MRDVYYHSSHIALDRAFREQSLSREQRVDCGFVARIFSLIACVIKKLFIHEQSNTSAHEVFSVVTTTGKGKLRQVADNVRSSAAAIGRRQITLLD